MKLFKLFRKTEREEKPGKFSEFFLHAPERKREEVLKEAARRANEEQKEVYMRSHFGAKTK